MLAMLMLSATLVPHPGTPVCPAAAALFRDVRAHTGGARWDAVREIVGDGVVFSAGLSGRSRLATDLVSGASATDDEIALSPELLVSEPDLAWKRDLTGGVHRLDAPDARAAARTAAYLARNGYFRPAADAATMTCLSTVSEDGAPLRRVRIAPRGGRVVTVWVDPVAHVVVRTQERAPTSLVTTNYGAYRIDGGLLLPHEIVETDDRPEDTVTHTIRSYHLARTVDARDFARPAASTNQRFAGGVTSSAIDADTATGSVIVDAYVNGHGPLPFILDTGGHAILTADAAKELGLSPQGGGVSGGGGEGTIAQQYARVRSLRIGSAEISDFPMFVIPYDKSFSYRGPGRPPLAGILGLEVFERFGVTIDYQHRRLTLRAPHDVAPQPGDMAVALSFQDDMPLAYATADGARGLFGVDTGNNGSLYLFGEFLRHHDLFARYPTGATGSSTGTGGAVQSSTHRLRAFAFGGLVMHDFITNFVVQQRGSFSSRTEAGNLGHDVLSQFTVTFDYARERMYLHREPDAALPSYTRTGLVVTSLDAHGRPVVGSVIAGSPAAEAGIATGDAIAAIGGTPVAQLSPLQMYASARAPAGSTVRYTIVNGTAQRDVTLTLRELLCNPGEPRCGPWVEPEARPR